MQGDDLQFTVSWCFSTEYIVFIKFYVEYFIEYYPVNFHFVDDFDHIRVQEIACHGIKIDANNERGIWKVWDNHQFYFTVTREKKDKGINVNEEMTFRYTTF